jgi:diguanylate cyclase (GGDEF)-like protein/PAS domain S-box-containing protein
MTHDRSNSRQDQATALIEGLEHLDVGVTVFTPDFKLVASNRRFQELLAFPDQLCLPGTHLSEFFRYNAERGEYGPGDVKAQVEARMAIARRGEPYRAERIRPDGTVLEVSGSTLPSGGLVTVYADITERYRRAEELERKVVERTAELEKNRAELAKKSQAMETIIEHVRHGITMFDGDLELVMCNSQFLDILRMPPEFGRPGTPFEAFMRINAERGEYGPGDIDEMIKERIKMARNMSAHRFERVRPDGSAVEIIGSPIPSGGFVTTYTDITERKTAERLLKESEERLRSVLEASSTGVAVSGRDDGVVRFANQRFADLLCRPLESLIGVKASSLHLNREQWREIMSRYKEGKDIHDEEVEFTRADGSTFWSLVTLKPIRFEGEVAVLTWAYDITEVRAIREKLSEMAHHDSLTGLANRRLFHDGLELALARSRRRARYGALLYCDLDGFKPINDRFGHECGDLVLKEVSERLRTCIRRSDLPARLGGDEFAIIVEDLNSPEEALEIGEKIIAAIAQPIPIYEMKVGVGCSIGIAIFDGSQESAERLIRQADKSMYEAKQAGKGCIRMAKVETNH